MIWLKCLDKFITRIPLKSTQRAQACMINFRGSRILWLNSYFPTDPQSPNFDDSELRETLAAISNVIENNEHDNILWQGDINSDFSRQSKFVEVVKDALTSLDLKSLWTKFPVDFTFCSPSDTSFSTLDHFLISEDLENIVSDAGVIHLGDNVSGHSPIYLKLNIGSLPEHQAQARQYSAKQNWRKATNEDKGKFKASVSNNLANIEMPAAVIDCSNVNCTDPTHRINIDSYTIDIMKCLESSAESHIPYTRSKPSKPSAKRKSVPGWKDLVKPQQDKARF